jgi:hypothetical protein
MAAACCTFLPAGSHLVPWSGLHGVARRPFPLPPGPLRQGLGDGLEVGHTVVTEDERDAAERRQKSPAVVGSEERCSPS